MRVRALEVLNSNLSLVGNPSALHMAGQRARRVLEEARERLAAAVGAHPSEVVFTSGGSEADSIALLGGVAGRTGEGRDRALVSAIEHPAVHQMVGRGAEEIPVTRVGVIDVDRALDLIDDRVAVVSVMAVNNETGAVQNVAALRAACAAAGAWLHTDAVQALGHVPVDFRGGGLDMMSLSGHKVGGPVGVGALLLRRELRPAAIGLGGGQERELRSGTVMVALAASFAAAAEEAVLDLEAESERLRTLQTGIAHLVERCGGVVNTPADASSPHILNATFPGIRADDALFLLDRQDVYASVGSACRAGVHQPSEVLLAMGRTVAEASASLRFSTGHATTARDIDRLAEVLPAAIAGARAAFAA